MNTMSNQALEASAYCLMFYMAFAWLTRMFTDPRFTAKFAITTGTATGIACKSISSLFGTAMSLCGIYVFHTIVHRRSVDFLVDRIFIFAMSYFLYDIYAMYLAYAAKRRETMSKDADKKVTLMSFAGSNGLITAHHLVIALFFIPLMSRCRNHDPGDLMVAAALVMEASTPFVSMRSILSELGLKRSRWYLVNGLVMMAVFFLCRIVIYFAFYFFYSHQRGIGFGEALHRTPRHCSVFLLVTFLPQLYWFRVMVRGAWKVFGDRDQPQQDPVRPIKSE